MPSAPPIAVSGATGRIGGRVSRLLADRGIDQRLIVRDAARAPRLRGAQVAVASYFDGDAMRAALDGVRTWFMVSATESADRLTQHCTAVDAAASAGVERIVYLSFFGAAPDAVFTLARDHWHTEQRIRSSGMAFTFLQDNLYADILPRMAGADGVIRGPADGGRFAPVAQHDIADAAVAVLTSPAGRHDGRSYRLTGPDLVNMTDVARILGAASGRPVRYQDQTERDAFDSRASYGAPAWQLRAWVSTYQAIAAGQLAPATEEVAALTGHPAMTVADVLDRAAR